MTLLRRSARNGRRRPGATEKPAGIPSRRTSVAPLVPQSCRGGRPTWPMYELSWRPPTMALNRRKSRRSGLSGDQLGLCRPAIALLVQTVPLRPKTHAAPVHGYRQTRDDGVPSAESATRACPVCPTAPALTSLSALLGPHRHFGCRPTLPRCSSCRKARPRRRCCRRRTARRRTLHRQFQLHPCRPAYCPAGSRRRRCGCRSTPPRCSSCRVIRPRWQCCRRRTARRKRLERRCQLRRYRPACCLVGSRQLRCGCRSTPPRCSSCRKARPRWRWCRQRTARLRSLARLVRPCQSQRACYLVGPRYRHSV